MLLSALSHLLVLLLITNNMYCLTPSLYFVREDVAEYQRDQLDGRNRRKLESYFNDVYKLLLNKLTEFEMAPLTTITEQKKLRAMLEELIQVKDILEGKK